MKDILPVPDLLFGDSSKRVGFSRSDLSGFDDLRASIIVRELLQNALDAALDAKKKTAEVRFLLSRARTEDIPGIEGYRKAFEGARVEHKARSGPTRRVVQTIQKALREDEHEILSVLDNGIGLDDDRMERLLADGASDKGGGAAGSFGIGHLVSIPASDLRYVLYGGLTADGARTASGHAALASRTVPEKLFLLSADGVLATGFRSGGKHHFGKEDAVPGMIDKALDLVGEGTGHGSAVLIPFFSRFRDPEVSLWDAVAKAAACNFFPAIRAGQLVVRVEDLVADEPEKKLDDHSLADVLGAHRDERRTSSGGVNGMHAAEMHDVLLSGESFDVETMQGAVRIFLLRKDTGDPRVDLCRNGMWITGGPGLSGLYRAFSDRQPFRALLLLDTASGSELHRLVRDAEGPLHDKLDMKRLEGGDKKALQGAFGEIREAIRERVPAMEGDSWTPPDDFMRLDFDDVSGSAKGGRRGAPRGVPVAVKRPRPSRSRKDHPQSGVKPATEQDEGKRTRSTSPPRSALMPSGPGIFVPMGPGRCRIRLKSEEGWDAAELWLRLDENNDETWEVGSVDRSTEMWLADVSLDGEPVDDDRLIRSQEGRTVGVRLDRIAAGSSVLVEAGYGFAEGVAIPEGSDPAVRVEVSKSRGQT